MKIEYDGKYPNLCRGHLFVTHEETRWDFGKYNLRSGGSAYFNKNSGEEVIESGPWTIEEFPEGFPEDESVRRWVLCEINFKIQHGCCGGCL